MELTGPNISTAYYNTGYTAYKQSDYTTAIGNLEKAVRFYPANREALFSLANSYNKNGDKEKAKDIFTKVKWTFPRNGEGIKRLKVYSLTEIEFILILEASIHISMKKETSRFKGFLFHDLLNFKFLYFVM